MIIICDTKTTRLM